MRGIVIAHNKGLGDLVVMNGCVRYLASQYDITYLICFESRLKHYQFLYRNDPNIILYPKPHPSTARQGRLRQMAAYEEIVEQNPNIDWSAGFRRTCWTTFEEWRKRLRELSLEESETIWPQLFYAIMKVPYSCRYEYLNIERDRSRENKLTNYLDLPEKYAFCVDDTRKHKYKIDWKTDLPIVNPLEIPVWEETLTFDWLSVIENASEIHTVDTSWLHLVRTLRLTVPKFYYQVRDLIMIQEGYLNDHHDKGWKRIFPKDITSTSKQGYWLK